MELKSNIKIKSDLYIRGTEDGSFSFSDENFTAQVKSRSALTKLTELAEKTGGTLKLTDVQRKILGLPPALETPKAPEIPKVTKAPEAPKIPEASQGTMPAVKPNTVPSAEPIAVHVAEPNIPQGEMPAVMPEVKPNTAHANEPIAVPAQGSEAPQGEMPAVKPSVMPEVRSNIAPAPKLSAISMDESILETEITEAEREPVTVPAPKPNVAHAPELGAISMDEAPAQPIQNEKIELGLEKFSKIDSGEAELKIVKASADAKIVLDGVCYSEELRIASERVEYILENDPSKRILVLCGTDIAAEKIKRGIKSALPDGSYIDLLDVFAAKHLFDIGESAAKITALSQEEKLALFNEKMKTDDLAGYDYCVIADLDELAARHITTLLKILVLLQCGYLLLSDRRRAVLKYGGGAFITNSNKLRDVLPENIERFSLDAPAHALSDEIGGIMTALTEGTPPDGALNALLEKMPSAEISALNSADGETAVLCRDSGTVEYVSFLLHKHGVAHSVLRGDMPSSARQLADILWDNHEKIIGRDNFVKRFIARCGGDEGSAEKYFNKLCSLTGRAPSEGLALARLAEVISLGGIPLDLLNISKDKLAVAEINSPYGKVFNKVYIADSGFNDTADAKTLYLAAAGRTEPPSLLKLGDMPDTAYSADGRCVHIGADGKAAFGLGCPEDIDQSSFIAGSMGDAVRKQAYISKNVKPGDGVTLKLNGAVYDIVHGSMVIGKTSAAFSEKLAAEFGGQRYFAPLPEQLVGAYVTDVVTVVSCRDPSEYKGVISPQFCDHRFWYGVELSGSGEPE